METSKIATQKKVYRSPEIEQIKLDNEISLILSSPAPMPDGWSKNQEHSTNDPFKTNVG